MSDGMTKRYGLHLFLRYFLGGIFLISLIFARPVQAAPLTAPIISISGACDLMGNAVFTITNTGDAMTVNYTWELYQESIFLTSGPFMLTAASTTGDTLQLTINGLYSNLTVGIKDNNGVQIASATAFCENHPTVTINQAAGQADPALSSPINFTARFSAPVTGFDASDVVISGMSATPGITVTDSGDQRTYNIAVTGMVLGETAIATIPANVALSVGVPGAGYGNQASTSTDNRITYQGPPVLSIMGTCDNSGNALFVITNIGGMMAVNYTWELYQESIFLTSGPFMLTVASSPGSTMQLSINGLYGNLTLDIKDNNGVQITSATAFCPDYRPTVTINQAATQSDPTNSSPILFDVVFSTAVTGFTNTDVIVSGMAAAPGITVTDSGDHIHYTVAVTGMASGETVSARIILNAATESHGSGNFASTSTDNHVTYETTRPSVTINQAVGQADPTSVLPILFDVTFSEQIDPATFTSGDIFVTGAASYSVVITDSGDHIHFTVAVSGISVGNVITAQIPVNTVSDRAGNLNFASTSTDNMVTYNDVTPPSVTVEQASGQTDPTSTSPIHFTAVFSEPINASTFTSSDVTLGGTTGANLVTITQLAPNDGTTFDIAVSGMTANGNVTASIPAGTVNDLTGNPNNASTSVDNTVTFDNSLPSVTVDQAAGQADPTNVTPIHFTVTFNESIDVSTFTNADITLGGTAGATTAIITEIAPNNGTTFDIEVSGMATNGVVTASLAANVVQDVTGNGNTASTSMDNSVIYDATALTIQVEQATGQADPTNVTPIHFTVTFNKPIDLSTFTNTDITLGGTAGATTAIITEIAPNNGTAFDIAVSGMTGSGTVTASIEVNNIQDLVGNFNAASTSTDNTVTFDQTSPLVSNTSLLASYNTTGPGTFAITFSKEVNNPAGDSDTDDVTNPDNYLIVERGVNGTFDTQSCIGGVQSDDVKVMVASVLYINPTAVVNFASPLALGNYRLFVCGTTSIIDLSGNHLGGGVDYTFDFTVTATTENPSTNEEETDKPIASSLPATGFAPNKMTSLPVQPATLAYAELGDLWLEIPSLKVTSSIVGVPQNKDNTWDVTWLGNNTGWLNGTAFPTWTGNSVLTAHVTNASGLAGPFAALKSLKYGDQIIVHMGGVKYIYEIRNSRLVRPYSTGFAFESLPDHSYLTLITCQGYNPVDETYLFRRVVRAVLVSVEDE